MSTFEKSLPEKPLSERTLAELCLELWHARTLILCGMVLGFFLALGFIFAAIPHYRAQLTVSPATPMDSAKSAAIMNDENILALRYIAQRAGISNASDFMRFETLYTGPSVATQLLKDPRILTGLNADRSFIILKQRPQYWSPSILAHYIKNRVDFEPIKATPLRRLTYLHKDPEFASYFLTRLHIITDALIREHIRTNTSERINYLQNAIQTTNNPEHRRALTTLLLEQERMRMLVSIDQPYAAEIIEPATSFFKPVWPNIALIYSTFLFAGAFLGFITHGLLTLYIQAKSDACPPRATKQKSWYDLRIQNNNDLLSTHSKGQKKEQYSDAAE